MAGLMHMHVYVVTFDIPTLVIVCSIVTLIFYIFYQIFYGLFYWFMQMRPNELHDLEEGTHLASFGASGSSQHFSIFHALVLGNLQAWTMVAALEGDFDENRGKKLRASKKLPPLVNYGRHEAIRSCNECAICLEDFEVDQFCQVFPVCKHIFHSDCIDHWLQKKLTCPICRSRCI